MVVTMQANTDTIDTATNMARDAVSMFCLTVIVPDVVDLGCGVAGCSIVGVKCGVAGCSTVGVKCGVAACSTVGVKCGVDGLPTTAVLGSRVT